MDGINKQSIVSGPMGYIGTAIYLHMSYWFTSRRYWPLAWLCWVVCCCSRAHMIPEKHTKPKKDESLGLPYKDRLNNGIIRRFRRPF